MPGDGMRGSRVHSVPNETPSRVPTSATGPRKAAAQRKAPRPQGPFPIGFAAGAPSRPSWRSLMFAKRLLYRCLPLPRSPTLPL